MTRILALLLLISPVALADTTQPAHSCKQPAVPAQFKDQAEADRFSANMDGYHGCITAFIKAQNDAIHKHRDAAQKATEEWNAFAESLK